MKKFLIFLILPLFFVTSLIAQTEEVPTTVVEVLNEDTTVDTVITLINPDAFPEEVTVVNVAVWLFNNFDRLIGWFIGLLTLLEVLFRAIKTNANISILAAISRFLDNAKLINLLTSNRTKSGGVFKTTEKIVKK